MPTFPTGAQDIVDAPGAQAAARKLEQAPELAVDVEADAMHAFRARLLGGVPRATRLAWRLHGRSRYRTAVVRLRGAPPAA